MTEDKACIDVFSVQFDFLFGILSLCAQFNDVLLIFHLSTNDDYERHWGVPCILFSLLLLSNVASLVPIHRLHLKHFKASLMIELVHLFVTLFGFGLLSSVILCTFYLRRSQESNVVWKQLTATRSSIEFLIGGFIKMAYLKMYSVKHIFYLNISTTISISTFAIREGLFRFSNPTFKIVAILTFSSIFDALFRQISFVLFLSYSSTTFILAPALLLILEVMFLYRVDKRILFLITDSVFSLFSGNIFLVYAASLNPGGYQELIIRYVLDIIFVIIVLTRDFSIVWFLWSFSSALMNNVTFTFFSLSSFDDKSAKFDDKTNP